MNHDDDGMHGRSIAAGACAGAIGGAAGAAVKLLCERIVPPRPPGREPPPGVLAAKLTRAVADVDLSKERREGVANVVHWIFSITTSAAYGAIAEVWPPATSAKGTGFGIVVWLGFHEITLPALGGTPPLAQLPLSEQANEFVTHAMFGATVETVRAAIRGRIGPRTAPP